MKSLQQMLDERLGHLNLSPDDYNSMACDIANDHVQAMLECGPEDYEDCDDDPDFDGEICCYCGSNKEPNVDYDVEKEDYVFAGTYSACECRSILSQIRPIPPMTLDDDDLPF